MTCRYDRMDNEPRATQMDSGPDAEESSARGPQGGEELSKTQTIRRDVDAQR